MTTTVEVPENLQTAFDEYCVHITQRRKKSIRSYFWSFPLGFAIAGALVFNLVSVPTTYFGVALVLLSFLPVGVSNFATRKENLAIEMIQAKFKSQDLRICHDMGLLADVVALK